ncbi:toll-like receptor 2 [Centruroides sculpturatus]|uniref:toll-like receptor 2 n=1 Tax=Centruroides sculpturatus TaxID=218467 RepID=UPI000C6CA541|nr:toll-like receptor 2 [Centruroides sculpturatus]
MFIFIWVFTATIYSSNSWNVTSDTCDDLKDHELLFMQNCKVSMNKQMLQASCGMYSSIESFSPYVGHKRYAIEMTIGIESDNFIYNLNERICLRLANLTIKKFRVSPHQMNNYGLKFSLLTPLASTLSGIRKVKIHINFNRSRIIGIAEALGECDVTSPKFDFMAIDERRNASCRLVLRGIYEMIMTAVRIKKFPKSKHELALLYNQFDQIYFLRQATVTEFSIYLTQNVKSIKLFSSIPEINVLKLEIPENHFDIIQNGDFSFTPKLEVLNMTKSTIYLIEENALDNLPGLRIVDFSRNRLYSIPEPFYKPQFINLTYLNLEANKPVSKEFSLPARSYSAPSNLKILILSKTYITHLQRGSFASFSHLRYLYLSECHLASIPEGTFDNLTSLVSLDLSRNRLEIIEDDIFVVLHSLQYLNLSSNRFYFIPQSSINFLFNLRFLNLENNAVKYLSNFSHLNLRYLNLRNNRIKEFTNESIDLPLLENLDISSNLISNFSKELLEILQNIKFVNLSWNPFNCLPCNLYYLRMWLNATDYRDSDNFICFLPEKISDEKVMNLPSRFEDCLRLETDATITIVISLCSTIFVILLAGSVIYYYRWSIRYSLFHLRSKIWYFKEEKLSSHQYKYDAFISFCDEEIEWVANELVPKLECEESGLKLCIRLRDFTLGEEIHQNIIDKIEESRKVVILLSDNFLKDNWRMTELYLAHDKLFEENRDALILVKMEELKKVLIPRKLRYLLKTRTYLLWATEENAQLLFWSRLKEAIVKYNNPNKMKGLV